MQKIIKILFFIIIALSITACNNKSINNINRSCNQDSDCKQTCPMECVNKNQKYKQPENLVCEKINCRCVNSICQELSLKVISEINPCENVSEEECFNKLSDCVEADSVSDYLNNKKGFSIDIEGWPDKFTEEITPAIKTNFPNAKIYLNRQPSGGGDYGAYPFINLGNKYCRLNLDNYKIIFSPILSSDDAIQYYLLINNKLTDAFSASQNFIMDKKAYEYGPTYQLRTGRCTSGELKEIEGKITTAKDENDGYLIDFIIYNQIGGITFTKKQVKVKKNGTIENIKTETLLDCGPGAVF